MSISPPTPQRSPEAGGPERPVFNLGGLLAPLMEAGYDDDAREVVESFLQDHEVKTRRISRALDEGDMDACADAAHSLVGSAGGIGARKLAAALDALEVACRANDPDAIEDARAAVEEEQEPVLVAARRYLEGGGGDD